MLFNSYSNRFCNFYIFPIVGMGAINFQSQKTANPPFLRCYCSPKEVEKFFDFDFRKPHNVLTFLCRIGISIMQGFPSRTFLKQRLAHSSVSAKAIPAF